MHVSPNVVKSFEAGIKAQYGFWNKINSAVPKFYANVNEFSEKVRSIILFPWFNANNIILKFEIGANTLLGTVLTEAKAYAINAFRVSLREVTIVSIKSNTNNTTTLTET